MDGNDQRNSRKERSSWSRHLVSSSQPAGQLPFTDSAGAAGDRKAEALRSAKEVPELHSSNVNGEPKWTRGRPGAHTAREWED